MAKDKVDIQEMFNQLTEQLSNKDGMSQLLQRNTIAGQMPFANFLMPMLMKQMGLPEFPTLPSDMGQQLHRNRGIVAAQNLWSTNPSFQGVQQNVRREMLTRYLAKGAQEGTAQYAKAREQALTTIGSAPKIDMVGGMLGLDIGAERALDDMTRGVGDFESAAASITHSTAKRYGAASFKDVRDRSREMIETLRDDILDDKDKGLPEGERRLRSDFKKRMGGMNVNEFAGTYEVMLREGMLSRDGKTATAQVKGMGGVIQAGKNLFGENASPEAILSAAREINGSIKPGDANQIKEAFDNIRTMLEVSGQSSQEYFSEVQKLRSVAAARGSFVSSKAAGAMVTDREMFTNALVSGGMDRTTASTVAYKRYETSMQVKTSSGEQLAVAALTAAGGDTKLADELLAGRGDDAARRRFGQARTDFYLDPEGKVFGMQAAMFDKSKAHSSWLASKAEAKILNDIAPYISKEGSLGVFNIKDTKQLRDVYNKVTAASGDPEKQAALAKELGVTVGDITTATGTFVSNGVGKMIRAWDTSQRNTFGVTTYTREDKARVKNAKKFNAAKNKADATAQNFDAEDAASVRAWMTTGKGLTSKAAELLYVPNERLSKSDQDRKTTYMQNLTKQMMALSTITEEDQKNFGITNIEAHQERIITTTAAEGMLLTPGITRQIASQYTEDQVATAKAQFQKGNKAHNDIVLENAVKPLKSDKISKSSIDDPTSTTIQPVGENKTFTEAAKEITNLTGKVAELKSTVVTATPALDKMVDVAAGVNTLSPDTIKVTPSSTPTKEGLSGSATYTDKDGNTVSIKDKTREEKDAANAAELARITKEQEERESRKPKSDAELAKDVDATLDAIHGKGAAAEHRAQKRAKEKESTAYWKEADLNQMDYDSANLQKEKDADLAEMEEEQKAAAEAAKKDTGRTLTDSGTAADVLPGKLGADGKLFDVNNPGPAPKPKMTMYEVNAAADALDKDPRFKPDAAKVKEDYKYTNPEAQKLYRDPPVEPAAPASKPVAQRGAGDNKLPELNLFIDGKQVEAVVTQRQQ